MSRNVAEDVAIAGYDIAVVAGSNIAVVAAANITVNVAGSNIAIVRQYFAVVRKQISVTTVSDV